MEKNRKAAVAVTAPHQKQSSQYIKWSIIIIYYYYYYCENYYRVRERIKFLKAFLGRLFRQSKASELLKNKKL
jgi:hypothetical protein